MASRRPFDERAADLADQVGIGDLTGRVYVNQRYAEVQERREDFKHPRGGQAHYLQTALEAPAAEYWLILADHAITRDGSDLVAGMRKVVEDVDDRVRDLAPVDLNNLRRSAATEVIDTDRVVYSRPPLQHRLSREERRNRRRGSRRGGR